MKSRTPKPYPTQCCAQGAINSPTPPTGTTPSGPPKRKERVKGIEPSSMAWKAIALPLSYTRVSRRLTIRAETLKEHRLKWTLLGLGNDLRENRRDYPGISQGCTPFGVNPPAIAHAFFGKSNPRFYRCPFVSTTTIHLSYADFFSAESHARRVTNKAFSGGCRIRTCEGNSHQIYSLTPLTARETPQDLDPCSQLKIGDNLHKMGELAKGLEPPTC